MREGGTHWKGGREMQTNDYCKLYLGYADYFDPLDDAEVGRLVRAMIQYKRDGTEPEFRRNERFVWPAIKRDIDFSAQRQKEISEARRNAGKKGGRPKKQEDGAAKNWVSEATGYDFSQVMVWYLQNVCESPTERETRELAEIAGEMQDNDCCIAIMETCVELRHKEWPYIKAALQQKIENGEDYLEAYKVSEEIRRQDNKNRNHSSRRIDWKEL